MLARIDKYTITTVEIECCGNCPFVKQVFDNHTLEKVNTCEMTDTKIQDNLRVISRACPMNKGEIKFVRSEGARTARPPVLKGYTVEMDTEE